MSLVDVTTTAPYATRYHGMVVVLDASTLYVRQADAPPAAQYRVDALAGTYTDATGRRRVFGAGPRTGLLCLTGSPRDLNDALAHPRLGEVLPALTTATGRTLIDILGQGVGDFVRVAVVHPAELVREVEPLDRSPLTFPAADIEQAGKHRAGRTPADPTPILVADENGSAPTVATCPGADSQRKA